ncbi:MAG: RNA polymerase sigma factor, partial [Oscillospiraceae bacterium]|nr:RNA polymerase sigma factor [Oscillospiraceae bacterium]
MSDFEILLAECQTALERYVRYRIPNRTDSDDVLQEIMLAAFRQFDRLKNRKNFKAWIIGIARNKCNDYYRSKRDTVCIDELPESLLVQSIHGLVEYSPVRETIDLLGEKDRQILQLCYYESLPQNEIAAKLNIPLGTVKG